jgi:hypothetical protein
MIDMMTISSREFNQDIGRAKRCAMNGPVFVTDRGHPAYVLLTMEEYQRISTPQKSIVDLLAMDETRIDFEPVRLDKALTKPVDLS